MPLRAGGSRATISQNIRELHTGKTYAHTEGKFGKERANKQAIAIALSTARKYKADGGPVNDNTDYIPLPVRIRMQRETDAKAALAAGVKPPRPLQVVPQEKAYGGPNLKPQLPPQPKPLGAGEMYKQGKADLFPNEGMEKMVTRGSMYGLRHEGMINSPIPGRTDKIGMNVKAGSYVLPADIPSALGQGNTMAGGAILKKMFSSGPYGLGGMGKAPMVRPPHMNFAKPPSMGKMGKNMPFAKGGTNHERSGDSEQGMDQSVDGVPIIAAGGEFIIAPDVVRDIGHGDIKAGHRVLDRFVLDVRKKHIDTLKKLKPPKK